MISINNLKIDVFAEKIDVDVNTVPGNTITKVLAWNSSTFKDYGQSIDLSSLLDGSDNTESFSISAELLGVEKITGIWYIEFESDEVVVPGDNNSNIALGITANLIPYHECVLNKVLNTKIKNCEVVATDGCGDCVSNLFYINTLVNSLDMAINGGFYEVVNRTVKALDDLCDICHTCPDYGDTLLINGLGYGTVNNSIVNI